MTTCTTGAGVCSFLLLLGRICLSILFLLSGIGKFMDPEATSLYMASKGMPMIPFFLYSAALLEVLGGAFLLFGLKTRLSAGVLALFLIPVTLIFHDFWDSPSTEVAEQMANFLKNLAIIGGLLYTVGCGAGKYSIDHFLTRE